MYRHSHLSSSNQSSGADAAAGSNKAKSTTGGGTSRAPLHDVNANTLDTTTTTKINNNKTACPPLKTNTKSTPNKVETSLVLDAQSAMKKQKSSNSRQSKPPMNNNNREWNFRNKQQQIKEAVTLSYSRNNSLTASSDEGSSTITKKEDDIIQSNLSDVLNETTEQLSKVQDDKEDTASVISEISDHTNTGGSSEENDIRLDPDTPARAVLRESMETDQAVVVTDKITVVKAAAGSSSSQTGRSRSREQEEIPPGNTVLDQSEGSLLHRSDKSIHTKVSRSGHQTINSDLTSSWSKKTFIWNDVTNTYNKFKETRSPNQSKLSSIIEDAQFTALYFCGIDTFGDEEAKVKYEESFKGLNKEERKKEVDDTFLGSVISCGPLSCAPSRCDVLCGTENDRPYHMTPP